jgi:hypothetical protein
MNLGWKLAATIHMKAPEGLLDSYYTERHPIGAQVFDWSRAQVAIMGPEPHARAPYAIISDLMTTRDGATYFAGRVRGINTQYNLGGDHPLVGRSVPNFELQDGSRIGELMHDGQGLLIDFSASKSLQPLVTQHAGNLRYVTGPARIELCITTALVLPDGIVAFATDDEPDPIEVTGAVNRWFSNSALAFCRRPD